jgi:hypothetical protein
VLNYPHPALTSYAFLKGGEGSNFQFNFSVTALGCVSKFQINSLFPSLPHLRATAIQKSRHPSTSS